VCGLINEFSEEQLRFIAHIEPMYIKACYPEPKIVMYGSYAKGYANPKMPLTC
jgi:predicted nucleotidyltransferase